ncbi:MAG TPA: hypothetical protein VJB57_02040 [Dehalococcoidia bacterium]|nr:hypothetical protein [Dehalococcoidia bacterium]
MTTDEEYETAIRAADKGLREAQTADDIRRVWREHVSALGHRTLGRLLGGMSVDRILDRREERAQGA